VARPIIGRDSAGSALLRSRQPNLLHDLTQRVFSEAIRSAARAAAGLRPEPPGPVGRLLDVRQAHDGLNSAWSRSTIGFGVTAGPVHEPAGRTEPRHACLVERPDVRRDRPARQSRHAQRPHRAVPDQRYGRRQIGEQQRAPCPTTTSLIRVRARRSGGCGYAVGHGRPRNEARVHQFSSSWDRTALARSLRPCGAQPPCQTCLPHRCS